MAKFTVGLSESDFVDETNRAHEVFLEMLRQHDASDSSFAYWLSSAALNLCSIFNDVGLNGKLKHADELVQAVKDGFEQVNDLLVDLSAEDKDDLDFSQAIFSQTFERKQGTPAEVTGATESGKEVVPEAMTSKEPTAMQFEKEETKCAICRGPFKRPKILPCSHICCLGCLEMAGRRAEKKPRDMMSCEICGQEFNIPEGGFDCLENFSAVEKITESAQVLDPSSTVNIILCEACADERDLNIGQEIPPAVTYCVGCVQNLCAECRRCHKRFKQLKIHKFRDFDDPQNVTTLFTQLRITTETGLIATIRTKAAEEIKKPVTGLTILDNELFVVSKESPEVEVYNSANFSFSRQWTLKQLIYPLDMVSCHRNKCLYISDDRVSGLSSYIFRVDPNGKLIKKWSTNIDCGFLSVTYDSNVILAVFSQNKLNEYSPDGQFIGEIHLSSDEGFCHPWHAIKLTNGNFIVSHGSCAKGDDDDLHRVCIVAADGKLLKSFGGKRGSTIGQTHLPAYLSVDGSGSVMVADFRNNRVLLLDSNLKFEKEILSQEHGLRGPTRILLDESNSRLFVSDYERNNSRILIFDLGLIRQTRNVTLNS